MSALSMVVLDLLRLGLTDKLFILGLVKMKHFRQNRRVVCRHRLTNLRILDGV